MSPLRPRRPMQMVRRWAGAGVRRVTGTLTHVSTRDPVAALTFDDGPDPDATPRLLELLAAHRARATFFMVGMRAERHPDLVARVAAEGHVIGNHSWDHPSFPLITGRERRGQIRACRRAISPHGHRLFRPPFGDQNLASWLDARWMGYRAVAWSVSGYDWLDHDGPALADLVMAELGPGDIVLFHDGLLDAAEDRFFSRDATLFAVELLLGRLAGRLQFVTIPELLRHGVPRWEHWALESSPEVLNRLTRRLGPARRYSAAASPAGLLGQADPQRGAGA